MWVEPSGFAKPEESLMANLYETFLLVSQGLRVLSSSFASLSCLWPFQEWPISDSVGDDAI
jgi:hypothetical protein